MALVDQPEEPEPDHQAGSYLDLLLLFGEGDGNSNGRTITSIANRWPSVCGQSAAANAREFPSMSPAEAASGHPISMTGLLGYKQWQRNR
jgi:hypothetical protein